MTAPFEKLLKSAESALLLCLRARPGEKILLVYDKTTSEIANAFIMAAENNNLELLPNLIEPTGCHGRNPDDKTAALLASHDIVVAPTLYSLTHCPAMLEARKKGLRGATLPGVTSDMFCRGLEIPPEELRARNQAWMDLLSAPAKVRVTSQKGTNLEFSIGRHGVRTDDGCIWDKGEIGNLPAGEVASAPDPGSANGAIVVDGSIGGQPWQPGGDPATVLVKDGRAVSFEGSQGARELRKVLAEAGDDAFVLAEFGIGTNPALRLGGNLLEDEKVSGTVHFAFGSNAGLGGDNNVPVHIDCVVTAPDVILPGMVPMKNGKWSF